MRKKILTVSLIIALVAIVFAGTLAYFSDTAEKTNVFTVGDVAIDLVEEFEDNSTLIPAVVVEDEEGNTIIKNAVTKEIAVENTGSEGAYVRVHIAVPTILVEGSGLYDYLHLVYDPDSIGDGLWNWTASLGSPYDTPVSAYDAVIGTIDYTVYVVTFEGLLATGDKTAKVMEEVYLDSEVTSQDVEDIKKILGDEWKIHVVAEAAQAQGFGDAYEALNGAFGLPGDYTVDWP